MHLYMKPGQKSGDRDLVYWPLSPVCPILVKGIAEVERESAVLDLIDVIFIP